jgi:hypothetical protein
MAFLMDDEPFKLKNESPPLPETEQTKQAPRVKGSWTPAPKGNAGRKFGNDKKTRLKIALDPRPSNKLKLAVNLSDMTIYRYRKEFRAERIAAGLMKDTEKE